MHPPPGPPTALKASCPAPAPAAGVSGLLCPSGIQWGLYAHYFTLSQPTGASEGRYPVCAVWAKLCVLVQGCNHKEGCLSLNWGPATEELSCGPKVLFLPYAMMAALGDSASPHYRTARRNEQHRSCRVAPCPTGQLPGAGRTAVTVLGRSRSGGRGTALGWFCRTGNQNRQECSAPCPGNCRHTLKRTAWSDALTKAHSENTQIVRKSATSDNDHFSLRFLNLGNANKKRKEWRGLKKI